MRTRFDISQQQVVGSIKSHYELPRLVEPGGQGDSWIWTRSTAISIVLRGERRPVVFFSEVDPQVFWTWRLQAIGKEDTVLLHSTRGASDPETIRARAIAAELQMELVEVGFDRTYAFDFLAGIGKSLDYPIGSLNIIEAARICGHVADLGPDAIAVDGIGADGLFGMNVSTSRVAYIERYPRWTRRLARRLFDAYLWRHPSGLPGKMAAVAKRSEVAFPPAALV